MILLACALLAMPATAPAKKKKKKVPFGPVATVTATGNTVTVFGQISTATATCSPGKVAVGGGHSVPVEQAPGNQLDVLSSHRLGTTAWTVRALHYSGTGAVTAYAYCRKASKSISDVVATGAVPSGTFGRGTAIAQCPSGTRLIGGGFESTNGPAPGDFAYVHTSIGNSSNAWTAAAINNGIAAQTVTAHAYCASGIPKPQLVQTTQTVVASPPNGKSTVTSPACPAKKKKKKGKKGKKPYVRRLSAGGFQVPPATSTTPLPIISDTRVDAGTWSASFVDPTNPGSVGFSVQGLCV